jgi:2-haloacid dehalogenase
MLISFDCYGTLIDWESGILNSIKPILQKHGVSPKDDEILRMYAEIEPEVERDFKPYKEVLKLVMEEFGRRFSIDLSEDEKNILVKSIGEWKPFPDVAETLSKLKKHYKIAVISNVDDDLFEKSQKKIEIEFDYVITALQAKAYKPSLKIFEYALKVFGIEKKDWIHVGQSVFHDVIPAKKFGIKTILVRRRGFGATPVIEGKADYTVENLEEILHILK